VIDAETGEDLSVEVLDFDLGVTFVSVAADRDLVHGRPPVDRRNLRTRTVESSQRFLIIKSFGARLNLEKGDELQ
jgi:hypothetical protein